MWQLKVWFVTAESDDDGHVIFVLPVRDWGPDGNCTRNHFNAVCFGTEEEALDFCYRHSSDHVKLTPVGLNFETEQLH